MNTETQSSQEALRALTKDIRSMATGLTVAQARFLVDYYYDMQGFRIRTGNQSFALGNSEEPSALIDFFQDQTQTVENQLKSILDHWTRGKHMGEWARSHMGIGPVLAAGLLAHIDITKAKTAGAIWRFAGQDPTCIWYGRGIREIITAARSNHKDDFEALLAVSRTINRPPSKILFDSGHITEIPSVSQAQIALEAKGVPPASQIQYYADNMLRCSVEEGRLQEFYRDTLGDQWPDKIQWEPIMKTLAKKPWNATLKVLCWKIGESFVKVSGRETAFYGQLYKQRKAFEVERNDSGGNKETAQDTLAKPSAPGKTTEAYKALAQGRLPDAQIHARAKRYAVKIFLAHWFEEAYRDHYKEEPPLPYPIAHLEHVHKIEAPSYE